MSTKNPLLDCGGSLAKTGVSVGEDLIRCAMLDVLPMPKTCRTFGILEDPDILTLLRLKSENGLLSAEELDEAAKTEAPGVELRKLLGVA
jgi:hypothetical protein